MNTIDRETLFGFFRDDIHPKLTAALDTPGVNGLAVYRDSEGKRYAVPAQDATLPETDAKGRALEGVYLQDRMRLAFEWLRDNPGQTVTAAAQRYGVSKQAVNDVLKRARKQALKDPRPVCPCCGQPIARPT